MHKLIDAVIYFYLTTNKVNHVISISHKIRTAFDIIKYYVLMNKQFLHDPLFKSAMSIPQVAKDFFDF